jgi:hypothetical protein
MTHPKKMVGCHHQQFMQLLDEAATTHKIKP